jgi:hypothetical protein
VPWQSRDTSCSRSAQRCGLLLKDSSEQGYLLLKVRSAPWQSRDTSCSSRSAQRRDRAGIPPALGSVSLSFASIHLQWWQFSMRKNTQYTCLEKFESWCRATFFSRKFFLLLCFFGFLFRLFTMKFYKIPSRHSI